MSLRETWSECGEKRKKTEVEEDHFCHEVGCPKRPPDNCFDARVAAVTWAKQKYVVFLRGKTREQEAEKPATVLTLAEHAYMLVPHKSEAGLIPKHHGRENGWRAWLSVGLVLHLSGRKTAMGL